MKLKAYKGDIYVPIYGSIADAKVYLKSEADKVITHHKYKRCLAMAKWCKMSARENDTRMCLPEKQKFTRHEEYLYFIGYYHKWHRRWLELAEKFKEAK